MLRSVSVLILFFGFLCIPVFAETLECSYVQGTCPADTKPLFYANSNLSSHVRLNTLDQGLYGYSVCCSSPYGELDFRGASSNASCSAKSEVLMYFTGETNARISFDNSNGLHSHKLCVEYPEKFSTLDVLVSESDAYASAGYDCLYRMNAPENGHVSSCDATYADDAKYRYKVWARFFENTDSLQCTNSCTSKLDGRVYSSCGSKITSCKFVPQACDGSLLDGWVVNPQNASEELRCSPPWKITRERVFTQESIAITSQPEKCRNIIKKSFTVLLDNEQVLLNLFMCGE